jgi:23S rRNA pseudouridine1911/1915/1917 synthase
MGYVRKKFTITEDIKAFKFLMDNFDCTMNEAQKWIDKRRVYLNGKVLLIKNSTIKGEVEVILFEPKKRGLKPIFETDFFAVFDKPSGVLVHPNRLSEEYSLNDEIKALYGKDANVVHRIDKETSGLVLVAKDKENEILLKKLFEDREIKKSYLALVRGRVDENFTIDANLKSNLPSSKIRIKSHVIDSGIRAITDIFPIKYLPLLNSTILRAMPLTGRTHQIRAHLFHVKHSIVGDTIYGQNEDVADMFLNQKIDKKERQKLTGANRLMLHAELLSFKYRGIEYNIKSKTDFERLIDEECKLR